MKQAALSDERWRGRDQRCFGLTAQLAESCVSLDLGLQKGQGLVLTQRGFPFKSQSWRTPEKPGATAIVFCWGFYFVFLNDYRFTGSCKNSAQSPVNPRADTLLWGCNVKLGKLTLVQCKREYRLHFCMRTCVYVCVKLLVTLLLLLSRFSRVRLCATP